MEDDLPYAEDSRYSSGARVTGYPCSRMATEQRPSFDVTSARAWTWWLTLALVVSLASAYTAQTADAERARPAIESWLAVADTRDGGATWDAAGGFFQNAMTREQWRMALDSVRAPLGSLKTRTLRRVVTSKAPPNAPEGAYVIAEFDSTFENRDIVFEAVTAFREEDGVWRVVGYFIR